MLGMLVSFHDLFSGATYSFVFKKDYSSTSRLTSLVVTQ